jgi:hypothetical protein
MDWFKFYHNKWLSDPAIITLAAEDRLCYLTILCLAAQDDERQGKVTRCNEDAILSVTHINSEVGKGVLQRLSERGLIQVESNGDIFVPKFAKRQQVALTNAERQARFRKKQNSNAEVTACNEEVTLDKIRGEEIRGDNSITTPKKKKSSKPKKHKYGEYKNVLLSDDEKQKLKEKFGVKKARRLVDNMDEAIEMKGYKYKSHYLAILKWERDDTGNQRFGASQPLPPRVSDELKVSRTRAQAAEEEREKAENMAGNERMRELAAQSKKLAESKNQNK